MPCWVLGLKVRGNCGDAIIRVLMFFYMFLRDYRHFVVKHFCTVSRLAHTVCDFLLVT